MTSELKDDGSEDVNDFLRRIRELDEKRNREDDERTKRLEEEILKGRQERKARRAERARSISPTKGSPSYTPLSLPSAGSITPISDLGILSSMDPARASDTHPRGLAIHGIGLSGQESPSTNEDSSRQVTPSRETSLDPENPTTASKLSPSAAIAPSRSSALSWQRRPEPTQSGRAKGRPMSAMNLGSLPPTISKSKTMPDVTSPAEKEPSRTEITQSLQLKDPSWFRQTEDRGASSPAYRRTPAGRTIDTTSTWARTRLPGMASDVTERVPRDSSSPPESVRSISPSRASSARDSVNLAYNYSTNTSLSGAPLTKIGFQRETVSPEPTSTHTSNPPEQAALERNPAMSPSQGRITSERLERPVSPTKGLGGFVQSAMMKRSDSVQKRWSTQSNTGMGRENSVLSRNGFGRAGSVPTISGAPSSPPRIESQRHSNSQGASGEPALGAEAQRSHGEPEKDDKEVDKEQISSPMDQTSDGKVFEQVAQPAHSRSQSITNAKDDGQTQASLSRQILMTPPSSPSKSADPKRWSPSKASWLESALNKAPESPKIKPPIMQPPSWMTAISKSKQQEATPSHGAGRAFQDVKTSGLMRAPGLSTPSSAFGTPNQSGPTSISKSRTPNGDETRQGSEARLMSPPSIAESPELTSRALPAGEVSENPSPPKPAERTLDTLSNSPKTPAAPPADSEQSVATATKSSPAVAKTKPPTPPKKDFRSVLKPRQAPENKSQQEEPEFKNVFGKLRHTKTQKYVAPNELKDNILRGKASLSVTGGPIKSERKDELKESLLKQKETIKAKAKVQKPQTPPKLSGTASSTKDQAIDTAGDSGMEVGNATATADATAGGTEGSEPSVAGARKENLHGPRPDMVPKQAILPIPTRNKGPASDINVTSKFSVRLAQMIARGPPSIAGTDEGVNQSVSTTQQQSSSVENNKLPEDVGSSGALTHMTKHRARGPKRRPPASNRDEDKMTVPSATVDGSNTLVEDKLDVRASSSKRLELQSSSSLNEAVDGEKLTAQNDDLKKPPSAQPMPADAIKDSSIDLAATKPSKPEEISAPVQTFVRATNATRSRPFQVSAFQGMPSAQAGARDDVAKDNHLNHLSIPSSPPGAQPDSKRRIGMQPSSRPSEERTVPGLNRYTTKSPSQAAVQPDKASSSNSNPGASTTAKARSPEVSIVRSLFADFFEDVSAPLSTVEVDTQALLSARSNANSPAKTIQKQIWEITGDGKEQHVPSHQEHILFEDKMYICTHLFETSDGAKQTEVYLWAGDDVPESAVEDAQLFARKVTRESGGRLIKFRQGREISNFFQALGGIIVTRRGPSSRVDSNTPYILCGRRHLGHIAFDQVDFSSSSFCSGFPYIISSPPRKTYLWKGRGSAADELGCARLIGMDVGLAGDLEEVDDGREPAAFLEVFKGGSEQRIPASADYWGLKPSHDGYCARLFCIDHQAESKVSEIRPFCQSDLDPSRIYCLDAFFEIYVIVGRQAQDKYAQFRTALTFAEEYGVLTTSVEKRPFEPVASVVLGDIPRDMKAVFRKWRDPSTSPRNPPLKVVPLSVAIEASR